MAKKGMARPERTKTHPKNVVSPVPRIQGEAQPIVAGTQGANLKVWHKERPISDAHGIIDNDLARDNLENDIPMADLQDL